MKNGDISRDELMKEAGEMMNKMKDLGGQDQFNDLFKNISKNMGGMAGMAGMAGMGGMGGMGGMEGLVGMLGKNMKMDTNAIDRMSKADSTKDRLRKVIEQRKQSEQITNSSNNGQIVNAIDYIHPDLIAEMDNEQSKNQSKNQNQSQKKKKKKGK
jgi:ABC-type sugar transport system ATPase subunit